MPALTTSILRCTAFYLAWLLAPAAALGAQSLVRDINTTAPGVGSIHGEVVAAGGRAFFVADDGIHGREVWTSDGTSAGTYLLIDLARGPDHGVGPGPLAPFRNGVLVAGDDGRTGSEPWFLSPTGSRPLCDLFPGPVGSNPAGFLVTSDDRAFFTANHPLYGVELFVMSAAGCSLVQDIHPGADGSFAVAVAETRRGVLVSATHPAYGRELWITSGAGASLLLDINPGPVGGVLTSVSPAGGPDVVFFAAVQPATGAELWRTDGTTAGTFLVQDLWPGPGGSGLRDLTAIGGVCCFLAATAATGLELHRATSAPGSISLLRDSVPGPTGMMTHHSRAVGSLAFFVVTGLGPFAEYWRTDGTSSGTFAVAPGIAIATSSIHPIGVGDRALLRARDPVFGEECWLTDGTTPGTRRLFDLSPGPGSSSPSGFSVVGDRVVFAADDGTVGRELFEIPLRLTGGSVVEEIGPGCPGTGGRVPRLGTVGVPSVGSATFGFRVEQALPSSAVALLVDLGSRPLALTGGCIYYLTPTPLGLAGTTDTAGTARWPQPVPADPTLVGLTLFAQAAVLDPNGAYASVLALTNGLRVVIGE